MQEPSRHEIWKMFDQISPTYDRINRLMTGGWDRQWRKKMAHFLPKQPHIALLDCATGTGDQILALIDHIDTAIGIDLSTEMLSCAQRKIDQRKLGETVSFQVASGMALPFSAHHFDCVTISFGIRNMSDVPLALREAYRVLKPQGRLLILEGSLPENRFLRPLCLFYLRHVLPHLGRILSNNSHAYRYLNQTIETFPYGKRFCSLLENAGFIHVNAHPQLFGAATIYEGVKDAP